MDLIAHRGASFDAPENTLASLRLAWKQGADAAEVDVVVSADQRLLVFHDRDTFRLSGKKRLVSKTSFRQLRRLDVGGWKGETWRGERMPTLQEVVDQLPSKKNLVVELKGGAPVLAPLSRWLEKATPPTNQLAFIGFSYPLIKRLKMRFPAFPAFWILDVPRKGRFNVTETIRRAGDAQLDGVDLSARIPLTPQRVQQFHRAGLRVWVWTVDDPRLALSLQGAGVDGLTTNRPGWIRKQLRNGGRG